MSRRSGPSRTWKTHHWDFEENLTNEQFFPRGWQWPKQSPSQRRRDPGKVLGLLEAGESGDGDSHRREGSHRQQGSSHAPHPRGRGRGRDSPPSLSSHPLISCQYLPLDKAHGSRGTKEPGMQCTGVSLPATAESRTERGFGRGRWGRG